MNLLVFCFAPLLMVIKALPVDVWSPLVIVTEGNHSRNALEILDGAMYTFSDPLCEDLYWENYCRGQLVDTWLDHPPKQLYLYITNLLGHVLFYVVLRNDVIGPTTTDIWFETATVVTSSYPEVGSSLKVQIDRCFMGVTAYRETWMSGNSIDKLNIDVIFSAFIYDSTWYNILSNHGGPEPVIISDSIEKCWPNFSPGTNVSDTECSSAASFSSCFICCISRDLQYALAKVGPGDTFLGVCRCYADTAVAMDNQDSGGCKKYDDCGDHSNQYCVFFHHLTALPVFLNEFFEPKVEEYLTSADFVVTEENQTLMINYTASIIDKPAYITLIDLITSIPQDFACPMLVTYTPFNHCGDVNPLLIYTMNGDGDVVSNSMVRVNVTGLDVFTFGCLNISSTCFSSSPYPSIKLTRINNHMYQAPTIRIQGTGGYLTPPDWNYFNFPAPSTLQPTTNEVTTTSTLQTTNTLNTTSSELTSTESTTTTSTATTASDTTTINNTDTTSTVSTSTEPTTTTSGATTTSETTTNNPDMTSAASTSTGSASTTSAATTTSAINNPDTTSLASTSFESTTGTTSAATMNKTKYVTAKSTSKTSTTISELEDGLVKIEHLNQSYICKEFKSYFISSLSVEELLEELARLQGNLTLNKESLSATIRKKTSAVDNRPSAISIGYLGIIILSCELGLLLLLDLRLFVLAFIKFKNTVIRLCKG